MQVERRTHQRYKVKDSAFAIISPDPVKLVPILDIAMGGIGIYVNSQNRWLKNASTLEIMVADCSFYLANLPIEFVSDHKASPAIPSNLLNGRRYCLEFGPLTASQKSELKYFIRNYSQGRTFRQMLWRVSKALYPSKASNHTEPSCNTGLWENMHRPTV